MITCFHIECLCINHKYVHQSVTLKLRITSDPMTGTGSQIITHDFCITEYQHFCLQHCLPQNPATPVCSAKATCTACRQVNMQIWVELKRPRQTCVWVHHVREAGFAALLLDLFPPSWPTSGTGIENDIQIQNRDSLPHLHSTGSSLSCT